MCRTRSIHTTCFAIIIIIFGVTLYLQYVDGIMPCLLCMMQRLALLVLGVLFLIGAITNPKRTFNYILSTLLLIFAAFGIFFASRQLWLQHLPPDQAPPCSAGLGFMLHNLPFKEVVQHVIEGSSDCTQTHWTFLGLNMAGWALAWFIVFLLIALFLLLKRNK